MAWLLNSPHDELKAMDRIGIAHYYMRHIAVAMFFHEKHQKGQSEAHQSPMRFLGTQKIKGTLRKQASRSHHCAQENQFATSSLEDNDFEYLLPEEHKRHMHKTYYRADQSRPFKFLKTLGKWCKEQGNKNIRSI